MGQTVSSTSPWFWSAVLWRKKEEDPLLKCHFARLPLTMLYSTYPWIQVYKCIGQWQGRNRQSFQVRSCNGTRNQYQSVLVHRVFRSLCLWNHSGNDIHLQRKKNGVQQIFKNRFGEILSRSLIQLRKISAPFSPPFSVSFMSRLGQALVPQRMEHVPQWKEQGREWSETGSP